jgi:hypothetical protein
MGKKRQRKPVVKDDPESVQSSETIAEGAKEVAQGSGDVGLAGEATPTSRRLAAEARADLAEASASVREAEAVGRAAGAEADRGAEDLSRGAELAELSDDFVTMAAAVRSLGIDEVRRGMELAAMSGQVAVLGDALAALGMRSMATFLAEMGGRMRSMADRDLALSRGTAQIATDMGAVGRAVGRLGAGEVAEGVVELAIAEGMRQASAELAAAVVAKAAEREATAGVEKVARGSAAGSTGTGTEEPAPV